MRTFLAGVLLSVLIFPVGVYAAEADPGAVEGLLQMLDTSNVTEAPRVSTTAGGYVAFLGAPPGGAFYTGNVTNSGEDIALKFMADHAGAFGYESPELLFSDIDVRTDGDRRVVRMCQRYDGVSVLAARVVMQLNEDGNVTYVSSRGLRDTTELDAGNPSVTPTFEETQALQKVRALIAEEQNWEPEDIYVSSEGLYIFEPSLLDLNGVVRLVWDVRVTSPQSPLLNERFLIDAHNGDVALRYSLNQRAKDREIYRVVFSEINYVAILPGELVRAEGDPLVDMLPYDLAYEYAGNFYDFYMAYHGRDGIDNAGMTMTITPEFKDFLYYPSEVFYGYNAYWDGDQAVFYPGMVADDILAHELTHGVTQYESGLIYFGFSGAINESFSDIWGEFVDLTNNAGNDSPEYKWLMGEDSAMGAMRSMADPTLYGDPDRLSSPYLIDPNSSTDNGGVHFNSGIGNKLCYLLTDGGTFNGKTVEAMGIPVVADLFYEVQTNLLFATADYYELYEALDQAAINLGLTYAQRVNIRNAAEAVEIVRLSSAVDPLEHFRATPIQNPDREYNILLTWNDYGSDWLTEATIVRRTDRFPTDPTDGDVIYNSDDQSFVIDTGVVLGEEYYYAIFADPIYSELPHAAFDRVPAGLEWRQYNTEDFLDEGTNTPIDLENMQLMFTPAIDGQAAIDSGQPAAYVVPDSYVGTADFVYDLPVPYDDDSTQLIFPEEGAIGIGLEAPFPYFGNFYEEVFLHANGFITFDGAVSRGSYLNFPSLEAHFAIPRISWLFSNLAPSIGGWSWYRLMDDRVVFTFVDMPEWQYESYPHLEGNTVQIELFYSGHIRITYNGLNIHQAIVGLSDGQGLPPDPRDYADGVFPSDIFSDLSHFPAKPPLTILPIPYQYVTEGGRVEFIAEAESTQAGQIQIEASLDGATPTVIGDYGRGTFTWDTGEHDSGIHTVRITATQGDLVVHQDVMVIVYDYAMAPEAHNLVIRTNDSNEDPGADRIVDTATPLYAEYDYVHDRADESPAFYGEGATRILWFRNNALAQAYTNCTYIPPTATEAGETWCFHVEPYTMMGYAGEVVVSPTVTIARPPVVSRITYNSGPMTGGTSIIIEGERLNNPLSVTFGGVPAQHVYSLSETRIEAVTPVHDPGTVDIVIETVDGPPVVLRDAFTFEDTGGDSGSSDEGLPAGCTGGLLESRTMPFGGDAFILAVALAALMLSAVIRRRA